VVDGSWGTDAAQVLDAGDGVALWFNARLWLRRGGVAAVLTAVTQVALVLTLAIGHGGTI